MKVGPIAEGQAQQILANANADAQRVVLDAQTNTAAFLALLPQYKASPAVMRERLYLDAMEAILKSTSKVLVDSASNNILYLPIDKLMKSTGLSAVANTDVDTAQTSTKTSLATSPNNTASNTLATSDNTRNERPTRLYESDSDTNPDNPKGGNNP